MNVCTKRREYKTSFVYTTWPKQHGRDWWLSPVTLLLEGKNCGMAEGCYGLNQADGCISVAALRPPCQGKAHRGPTPMTRRLTQLNAATQVRVPGNTARPSSQYCNNVLKNVKKKKINNIDFLNVMSAYLTLSY